MNTQDLNITLVQTSIIWENTHENLALLDTRLSQILSGQTDLIILPEMFHAGFTMNAKKNALPPENDVIKWMEKTASEKRAVITGSIIVKENEQFFNRLIWMCPDGAYYHYDKRHTFRMAGEHHVYTSGSKKIIMNIKGWNVLPLICYDLRFPVWSRQSKEEKYDLLVYVANWPEKRSYAWKQLQIARAIENQCFVAGVNRTGMDGTGVLYSGDSMLTGPRGEVLKSLTPYQETVETVRLSYKDLSQYREDFPVLLDADDFRLNP